MRYYLIISYFLVQQIIVSYIESRVMRFNGAEVGLFWEINLPIYFDIQFNKTFKLNLELCYIYSLRHKCSNSKYSIEQVCF